MTRWFHLFPSRTQQLSTAVAKVSAPAGRIARCRAFFFYRPKISINSTFYILLLPVEWAKNPYLYIAYAYGII